MWLAKKCDMESILITDGQNVAKMSPLNDGTLGKMLPYTILGHRLNTTSEGRMQILSEQYYFLQYLDFP